MEFRDFKLSSSSPANTACFLKNNKVFIIQHIGLQNGNPVIIGQEFKNYFFFKFYPCNSRCMDVFVINKNDLTELKCVSINEILRKAVVLLYKKDKLCVFPLLHSDIQLGQVYN